MTIELEPLPYAENALEPHIDARTVQFHYHKHHAGYVTKLNNAIEGTRFGDAGLEQIVAEADAGGVFNNAAQIWNHTFYWKSMAPVANRSAEPGPLVAAAIDKAFGSLQDFRGKFAAEAAGHFGSGWAWLVVNGSGELEITSTHDADTPLRHSQTPLLTLDVWEHAYYLNYQNQRPAYIDAFLDHLINWDFAEENLKAAKA